VRSALPIVGTAHTENAALFEVAYMVENLFFQVTGQYDGHPELYKSMATSLKTLLSVWSSCPNAFMHPGVFSSTGKKMSSGGGAPNNCISSEDWVLQYPHTCSAKDVDCRNVRVKCNNCESGCVETLVHEFGHTVHLWAEGNVIGGIRERMYQIFNTNPSVGYHLEYPAWAAQKWFQNEGQNGRRPGPGTPEYRWMAETLGFNYSNPWRYVSKTRRCPGKRYTEACDDAAIRTRKVWADSWP
jgi:hypothetical protein